MWTKIHQQWQSEMLLAICKESLPKLAKTFLNSRSKLAVNFKKYFFWAIIVIHWLMHFFLRHLLGVLSLLLESNFTLTRASVYLEFMNKPSFSWVYWDIHTTLSILLTQKQISKKLFNSCRIVRSLSWKKAIKLLSAALAWVLVW